MRLLIATSLGAGYTSSCKILKLESRLPVSYLYRRCGWHDKIAQLRELALLSADHSEAAEQV